MMKRSIVMTSDPFAMPVRGKSDRTVPIGPENRDAVSRQPLEDLGGRVPVVVVHIERQPEPERVGAQYLEHHTVHLDPVSRPRPVPPRARCLDTSEKLEIHTPSQRPPPPQHQPRTEHLNDRRQPA